jgi:hypothetical protein
VAIGYPGSIDTLTNPTSGNNLNSPDHANQHSDENDAIEALEAKVGITGSAVTTSLDYLVANNLGKPMNLTGATAATRYVGGRATSIPTTGTFIAGDFVVLQSGAIGVCTVGGSPGTWVTLSSGSGTFGLGLADYQIYKSGANFIARNTATNIDDFTSTNAASVVQSCHDALGRAGLIELKRGIAYTATSQVTLTTDGVMVRSTPQTGEDQSTSWKRILGLSGRVGVGRFGHGARRDLHRRERERRLRGGHARGGRHVLRVERQRRECRELLPRRSERRAAVHVLEHPQR